MNKTIITVELLTEIMNSDAMAEAQHSDFMREVYALAIQQLNGQDEVASVADVKAERLRQINELKRLPEDDDKYQDGELAEAGAAYALAGPQGTRLAADLWPWGEKHFIRTEPRDYLVKGAALLLAEIDRLDRETIRKEAAH